MSLFKTWLFATLVYSSIGSATVYYVDGNAGNDANSGLSTAAPFKSLSKVNALALKAGDSVLFKRGAIYKGTLVVKSGASGKPMTYRAYGTGANPLISGYDTKSYTVDGRDKHYVVLDNLKLSSALQSGIMLQRSVGWKITNVYISSMGGPLLYGAIHCSGKATESNPFPGCKDLTIDHVTIRDTSGDGIYLAGGERINITNSIVELSQGGTADNIQVSFSRDVRINGNYVSQAGSSTGKGNICLCDTIKSSAYATNEVRNNYMYGGNFGLAAHGEKILVDNNDFEAHTAQSWSSGIVSGDMPVQKDITITNNAFIRDRIGITIGGTSTSEVRSGYILNNNLFFLPLDLGVHIYTTRVTGTAKNNIMYTTIPNDKMFDTSSALVVSGSVITATRPAFSRIQLPGIGAKTGA